MKNHILIAAVLLLSINSQAQNTHLDYKRAIKLYNLTRGMDDDSSEYLDSNKHTQHKNSNWQAFHPTIAFQWKTRKSNFHEIELTDFSLDKNRSTTDIVYDSTWQIISRTGYNTSTTNIALRYEYILNFNKSKNRKLVPSLGFALSPYFRMEKNSPVNSSTFRTSEKNFGMKGFITPRINYYFSPKLFMDLDIPICLFDSYTQSEKTSNPSLPSSENTYTTSNFEGFPNMFSGRLGLGVKI